MTYILSFIVAFGVAAILGQILIPVLRRLKAGQSIREDGPTWHMSKQGTPTMGGLMFILAMAVAVLVAGWEEMLQGNYNHIFVFLFALVFGVVCDLLLPTPIPCFYTLVFPVAALCAALLTQSVLRAGYGSALLSTAIGFLLSGLFGCLLLWFRGKTDWEAGMLLTLRECLVTLPLVLPATALFRVVHRRVHRDD